jgi:hypothetical protein
MGIERADESGRPFHFGNKRPLSVKGTHNASGDWIAALDLDDTRTLRHVGTALCSLRNVHHDRFADGVECNRVERAEIDLAELRRIFSQVAHDARRNNAEKGFFWAIARDDRPWGGTDPPAVA